MVSFHCGYVSYCDIVGHLHFIISVAIFRYSGDVEHGAAVMRLLKICTFLDPRLMRAVDGVSTIKDVLIEAVALGKRVR